MKYLTAAITLIVIIIGIISAVYLGERNSAKQVLLINMPKRKRTAEWKTSQKNALVNFLISSLNKLQKLENGISYCESVIAWHTNRIKAFTFLRKKDEVEKENEAVKSNNEKISKLIKEKKDLLSGFKDAIPKTKDKTIASAEELKSFGNATKGIISTLLHNPKFCKTSNGYSVFLCANFYVMQNKNHVTIEPYHNVLVKETYELQNIGHLVNPAPDDEVAQKRHMHERKKGGPDRRYSYNPLVYIVYRGIVSLTFNGASHTPIKFSNRKKAHSCFIVLNSLIERASFVTNKKIFRRMLSVGKLCSAKEISKIIETEEEAERNKKLESEREGKLESDAEDLVVKVELPSQEVFIENAKKASYQTISSPAEGEIKIYDYQISTNLKFTKPILVMYFGEINSKVKSWREVYCSVLYSLWEDYPAIIQELAEKSDFTTISHDKESLKQAMQVTSTLFAEGNRSASELGRAIRELVDLCNIDYENVVIRYVTNKEDIDNTAKENFEQGFKIEQHLLPQGENLSKLDNEIYEIVRLKYLNGFLLGAINFKKIRRFYVEIFSKKLEIENTAIEESLRKTCLYLNGKYYATDTLMEDKLKCNVAEYIKEGVKANGYVYYKMIIDNFGYELTEHIPDIDLLKKYLSKVFSQYVYFDEYLARDKEVIIDVTKEVEQILLDAVYPISFEKIRSMLPHLTEEVIKKVVLSDNHIICTNNNERFHIDSMGLSNDDLKGISDIISAVLKEHDCMFGNELLQGIQNKMPILYEGIKEFGDRGIRGAVAYKLKNRFKFNSNIICNIGTNIDNAEVFRSFADAERYFTLAALGNLKEQIGIRNIYFNSVNEVASRINSNDYVPNRSLSFNEQAIDELLEQIIPGKMASIKEASNFAVYPSTCYPWTEYLLESYVAKFSKKFKLIHIGYAESKCTGAIVKRASHIDSMDAVVTEYLVKHEEIQTADTALNELVEDGYITKKRYKNIEDLLVLAKSKRRE